MKDSSFLSKVIRWEKELTPKLRELETPSGLFLKLDYEGTNGYFCTPVDAVNFANTGADGVHYAFLTDFGRYDNLDECLIIRVSPMNPTAIQVVARNIKDFFSLQLCGNADLLFNDFLSEEAYVEFLEEQEKDTTSVYFDYKSWKAEQEIAAESAQSSLNLRPIKNAYTYIQELRAERRREIVLETQDGLGIMPISSNRRDSYRKHPWWKQDIIPCRDYEILKNFLETEQLETILAFVRDYQNQAIWDTPSLNLICDKLEELGYFSEALRLQNIL
ncbi:hypothetical protein [Paenibacillus sp. YPG26]|uniref:hypothetical protein n=1 Tax=Paenibacillus sp. YPG26 TaxID=2878915 RepID=UPI00203E4B3D|nr:hypothetical protein [Paenibacillus sp. YPG26]USB31843.1 hypothetical protein LDO05_10820 [Paenibacillus sp. YPG26]